MTSKWFGSLTNQSSGHTAYSDDALNVNRMNIKDGGKQSTLRDTSWNEKLQRMKHPNGKPRGVKTILEERGVNTSGMVGDDMRKILSRHPDFLH